MTAQEPSGSGQVWRVEVGHLQVSGDVIEYPDFYMNGKWINPVDVEESLNALEARVVALQGERDAAKARAGVNANERTAYKISWQEAEEDKQGLKALFEYADARRVALKEQNRIAVEALIDRHQYTQHRIECETAKGGPECTCGLLDSDERVKAVLAVLKETK